MNEEKGSLGGDRTILELGPVDNPAAVYMYYISFQRGPVIREFYCL